MIPSQTIQDCLQRAFVPAQRGIVGLTEQLLGVCAAGDVEFERVGDRCVCRWTVDGDTQETTAPLPPTAFRVILAQVVSSVLAWGQNCAVARARARRQDRGPGRALS